MRLFELFFFGVIAGPLISAIIWMVWVVKAFQLKPPIGKDIKRAAELAFYASDLIPISMASLAIGCGLTALVLLLVWLLESPNRKPRIGRCVPGGAGPGLGLRHHCASCEASRQPPSQRAPTHCRA